MADNSATIDQIIAGGAGASSRADFSKLPGILDSYYKGRDEAAKNDQRDLFKDGVPTTPDGQPDFAAMGKMLFQSGALDQGVGAAKLGIEQQNLQGARDDAAFIAGGSARPQQSTIVSPPSINRSGTAVVAPPLNKGGAVPAGNSQDAPQGQPQGGATVMQVLAAQGIPNDQLGAASASIARQLGLQDPNAPINVQDPQVRNVLVPAVQQLKRMGIGQVQGQPQPQEPQQGQPQQPQGAPPPTQPQVQPVAQMTPQQPVPQQQGQPAPNPFANAQAAGLIPQGVDPTRYVAGLKLRAAGSPNPQVQKAATQQIEAITKATELTAAQRDFNASRANPGLDDYAAQKEAASASAKGVAESDVKEQNELIGAGKTASNRLTTLNTISNIINSDKNLTLGFGADTALKVKMALKSIGIDTGDLSGAESIQKLNALLASESTKSISPRPAQFEFKTFLGNNPGLSLDKQGNQRVIGIFSQLAKRDVDLGRLARQNRDNWNNWDGIVESYDKSHPITDPTSGKVITTDSVVAPGPSKTSAPGGMRTFSSPSEVHAAGLPSGTKFIDNTGKIRQVP